MIDVADLTIDVIDAKGNLFITSGSESNACEKPARQPAAKGETPCKELATRAGIWRYDASKTGQKFSAKERYITGLRNSGGQSFDSAGRLYAVQHGRDQLPESWPKLYTMSAGHELPAEVMVQVEEGADYGWPTCYYDGGLKKNMLAPEYGGDGKTEGECAQKHPPAAAFPDRPNASSAFQPNACATASASAPSRISTGICGRGAIAPIIPPELADFPRSTWGLPG